MGLVGQAGARLAIDRLDAHAVHKRGDVTSTDRVAFVLEQTGELARAQERMLQVQFVQTTHEGEIGRADLSGSVVRRGARQPQ